MYKTTAKVYAYRSLLVHGSTNVRPKDRTVGMPDGSQGNAVEVAVELLRALLQYAVDQSETWSPALLDKALFDRLRPD